MSRGRTRAVAAIVVAVAAAIALAAWVVRDRGTASEVRPISPAAARALPGLTARPDRLPEPPADREATVMLLLGIDDAGDVSLDGPPIALSPSSLRFARAITRRRTTAPPMWVLVRDRGADDVRYWVPLNPSEAIRVNVREADDLFHHQGNLERIPEMYQTVRVPFYPGAVVEFVHDDATGAGSFRFGAEPTDPMEALP